MKVTGGLTAPRTGTYRVRKAGDPTFQIEVEGRTHLNLPREAGEKFPGGADIEYECNELRPGEVVPKSGVWLHMPSGLEHALEEGATFPAADGGDYVWTRAAGEEG